MLKLTTGADENFSLMNIYDIAGNVDEWTQEKCSTGTYRANRGGNYHNIGDDCPAADRYGNDESYTDSNLRV